MPFVDPEFTVPTIPEDEKYEGTEVDDNVRKGTKLSETPRKQALTLSFSPSPELQDIMGCYSWRFLLGYHNQDRRRARGWLSEVILHESLHHT